MGIALIIIGLVFLYLLFGYIFTTVLLALGEDFCEDVAPWLTTNDVGFSLLLGSSLWPLIIFLMIIIAFCKVISVIGDKMAVLPVTIALLIKYKIDKKEVRNERETDEEESEKAD